MTLTRAAFCHGHWDLIIVSGIPESSAGVAWKERSCMQTAKQSLTASLNSFGSDFYVWKRVSFKDPSEIHISQSDRTRNAGRFEINAEAALWRTRKTTGESVQASETRLCDFYVNIILFPLTSNPKLLLNDKSQCWCSWFFFFPFFSPLSLHWRYDRVPCCFVEILEITGTRNPC